MRLRLRDCVAIAALVAVAQLALSAASPFSHGLIQSSCAPWDGPAIQITLTTSPAQCDRVPDPYLSMGVWRGLPIHDGQVVKFGGGTDAGFASRCNKVGDCQRADSGTIVFEKYEEGSRARGRYEIQFKSGETLTGTFDVPWCKTRTVCG